MTQVAPMLAGAERPLQALTTPANDEVLAIFRNGAVIDVVAPGRRARPLWYKTRFGGLTYARILRSDIVLDATVTNVLLADRFQLPAVTISCRVALNPSDGYANLTQRLNRRGLRFAEALQDEAYASLTTLVRTLFSSRTHEAVSLDPRPAGIGKGQEVLGGLFVVDAIEQLDVTSDPHFEEIRMATTGVVVDQHVITREGEAQRRRDAYLEEEASRRGIPLYVMENPELLVSREQHAVDLIRIEAETRQVEIRAQADLAMEQARNITALTRAAAANRGLPFTPVSVLSSAGPIDMTHPGRATRGGPTYHPAPLQSLARDSALQRQWKATVGLRPGLRGAVRTREGDAELIVLVLDPDWFEDRPRLDHALADAYPHIATVAIPAELDLATWVASLTQARVRDIEALAPTYTVEESNDHLRVQVGSGNGSAMRVVEAVTAPSTLILPALRDLLPYADVTCVPTH